MILESLIKMEFLNLTNWKMVEKTICHRLWVMEYLKISKFYTYGEETESTLQSCLI